LCNGSGKVIGEIELAQLPKPVRLEYKLATTIAWLMAYSGVGQPQPWAILYNNDSAKRHQAQPLVFSPLLAEAHYFGGLLLSETLKSFSCSTPQRRCLIGT
jgi:hypothetical protein